VFPDPSAAVRVQKLFEGQRKLDRFGRNEEAVAVDDVVDFSSTVAAFGRPPVSGTRGLGAATSGAPRRQCAYLVTNIVCASVALQKNNKRDSPRHCLITID